MANYRSLAGGFFSSDPYNKSMPVSVRTNNPGAINAVAWIKAYPGYVADTITSMSGASSNNTAIFEAPEYGVAAWFILLQKYRASGVTTISGIINRYGGGQNYNAYANFVAGHSGLTPSYEIKLAGDDGNLLRFARAMFRFEAGKESPLSDAQIMYGIRYARGEKQRKGFFAELLQAIIDLLRQLFRPAPPLPPATPFWMPFAKFDLGLKETPGPKSTNRIIEIRRLAGCSLTGDDGAVAWCKIWVNAVMVQANLPIMRDWMARSIERDPNFVRLSSPAYGCLVSFYRNGRQSGQGHIGFYVGQSGTRVRILGANQSDAVNESWFSMNEFTGFWWPKSVAVPVTGTVNLYDDGSAAPTTQ